MTAVASRLRGVLAPVATPFGNDSELSHDGFVHNVRAHLDDGVHGIVLAGSTGEATLLDEAERLALVELSRPLVGDDRLLVCGVGAESTRQTIRLARGAAERGADAVLVVAPHYYGALSSDALRSHFTAVADASPVPVVLYNIPKYMHFNLAPELVHALARHENVIGIKDSSGNAAQLEAYLGADSPSFRVITGSGVLFRQALAMGAAGGILAVALFAAPIALAVLEDATTGDGEAADAAQARLTPLAAEIVGGLGVPGVKGALDAVGRHGGMPRPPLLPLAEPDRARVAGLIAAAGLAPVS